jgi:hypothetical protein
MDENRADTPEQVVKFAPKERPRSYGTPAEEPGQAIIAKIQKADDLSNENCDRATALAQRLSMQFRAAKDRINRLEGGRTSETGRSAPQDDFRRSRKLVCVRFSDARQRISLDARSARYRRLAKECLDIARTFSNGGTANGPATDGASLAATSRPIHGQQHVPARPRHATGRDACDMPSGALGRRTIAELVVGLDLRSHPTFCWAYRDLTLLVRGSEANEQFCALRD